MSRRTRGFSRARSLGFSLLLVILMFSLQSIGSLTVRARALTLSPTDDSYVSIYNQAVYLPNANYGTLEYIRVSNYGDDVGYAFLMFDLSTIPTGSTIVSANLMLYDQLGTGNYGIAAYRVDESWNETHITWNNMPSIENAYTYLCGFPAANPWTFDVKSDVQKFVSGSASNYGWCLAIDAQGYGYYGWRTFASKEYVGDPSTRPVLEVTYVARAYSVVRGMDDRIYYQAWDGTNWQGWNALPGSTIDSPAAAMLGGELHVVVRGSDGYSLWYGYLANITDPSSFSSWTLLSGATSSAPTLTSNGTSLCLVVRGEDNLIYYRFYSDSSWGDWSALPSGATLDSPAAVMLGDELHIVVRGMDGYSLWHCYVNLTDNSFSGWTLLSGATQSKPVLALDQAEDQLCLAVRGLDDRIYWRTYDAMGKSWADWSVISSGATPEGPAATMFGGSLQIVVQGMDGSSIWQGNIDLSTTNFSGWTLLTGATPSAPTLTS